MSLPTDPFAAPSTGPQAVVLRRADEGDLAAWDPDAQEARSRRPAVVAAGAAGVLVVGASVVGVALGSGSPAPLPSSLAPAAGAAATLTPPAVGNPIVPAEVTPPAVTTRERPVAETTRSAAPTRERAARPRIVTGRQLAAIIEARIEQRIERAQQRAHGHRHGARHR
ncbi:hypothetical protein [Actinomycetospora termitidis]|uniref:Uncharacterized protein n=1 Tax=Actinomycetospora termitidis TaxID=3053470 RepID=A0ABT7M8Z3_9PSEU|nr:hypothetical protein [Actinomycetospora sp. Odt1-22]MDL5157130.1 hypothetical protein [Actinomycetospora sp. Odt1-22]